MNPRPRLVNRLALKRLRIPALTPRSPGPARIGNSNIRLASPTAPVLCRSPHGGANAEVRLGGISRQTEPDRHRRTTASSNHSLGFMLLPGTAASGRTWRNSANEFDRELRRTRKPWDRQLIQWREGIRWFLAFLGEPAASQEPRSPTAKPGQPAWCLAMTGQSRLKHLSYRTEQTYAEWVSSFAGFLSGTDPMAASNADAVRNTRI